MLKSHTQIYEAQKNVYKIINLDDVKITHTNIRKTKKKNVYTIINLDDVKFTRTNLRKTKNVYEIYKKDKKEQVSVLTRYRDRES